MKTIFSIVIGALALCNQAFADAIIMAETKSGKVIKISYEALGSIGWGYVNSAELSITDKAGKTIFTDTLSSIQLYSEAYNDHAETKEEELVSIILRAKLKKSDVELIFVGKNSIDHEENLLQHLQNPKRVQDERKSSLIISVKGGQTYSFSDIICAVFPGDI